MLESSESNQRRWVVRGVRLLQADPDLGAELSADDREQVARQLVLPTLTLEPGPWDVEHLDRVQGVEGDAYGLLLLTGMIAIRVAIAGRTCTRLILPQELLLLDGTEEDTLPTRWSWSAVEPATLAVLDRRLLLAGSRWPGLMAAIIKRSALQVRQGLLQQSISQLPRVEDRLLALMWSIADRRGIVRGEQIWIPLPVTHEILAQLIGARRPTVSLGLKKLADDGQVVLDGEGWLIQRSSLSVFQDALAH